MLKPKNVTHAHYARWACSCMIVPSLVPRPSSKAHALLHLNPALLLEQLRHTLMHLNPALLLEQLRHALLHLNPALLSEQLRHALLQLNPSSIIYGVTIHFLSFR